MAEVVNVLVAFAVIVFLFRWVTSSSESPAQQNAASVLGFRPKNVTDQMIETIHSMFPDIPPDNIRYDLLRTGSVEQTSNKILEKGFLDAPPAAYYTLYPRDAAANPNSATAQGAAAPNAQAEKRKQESLIARYGLQDRIASSPPEGVEGKDKGKGMSGNGLWEDSAEKREASLRERKAQMILAARQRMLEQQKKSQATPAG